MNTKIKKILIVIIIILVIALIGLLIYSLFIKTPDSTTIRPGDFPEGEESDFVPDEDFVFESEMKIRAISEKDVLSPTTNNDKVTYYSPDGNIWKSNFDGTELEQISDNVLDNLIMVFWSPNKNESITVFQDTAGTVSKYLYNHENEQASSLNQYINYISWSPDGKKIAYQYENKSTGDNTISTSDPDGSNFSVILRTRIKDFAINWPNGSEIFLREKPSGLVPSSLYSLNILSKAFSKIISDVYGFSAKWSLDGSKILYSRTDTKGKTISLNVANRNGSNQESLGINTLVEKCAWSQDIRIIYCAIPMNIDQARILPDDFYKGSFIGNDDFWKINIETGKKEKLLEELPELYNAKDLFLSPNEDYLFFINKNNGLLYSIKL